MKIETVKNHEGKHIGYRIQEGENAVLIYADQEAMPGIRNGSSFCPPVFKEFSYEECRIEPTGKIHKEV